MKTRLPHALAACLALAAPFAAAEEADYGAIELTGLARDMSWPLNPPGESYAMVCNVNGPDGFLTVRAGPGAEHDPMRSLKRLATVTVDTRQREGRWVRVLGADRAFSTDGERLAEGRPLPVQGWAHDGYLCSFIDYDDAAFLDAPAPSPAGTSQGPLRLEAACYAPEAGRYDCTVELEDDGSFTARAPGQDDAIFLMTEPGLWERLGYDAAQDRGIRMGVYAAEDGTPCWQDVQFEEARFCFDAAGGGALPAAARASPCRDAVQGKLAWNYDGATDWADGSLDRLCGGAASAAPARCFERVMFGGVDWGGGTRWGWENAADLCRGAGKAAAPVRCFRARMPELGWEAAIRECRGRG